MDREAFQERFGLIGESAALKQVIDKAVQVADTDITILLQGESGVGKDITARAIHSISKRKNQDLVIVNCGAIPEGIIESELFGHERGAFTGAHEAREGYFEKADGGTIFLDEIGDTPKNVQVKLLRVLETGEYFRVGSSKLKKTDVRVIAATNKDLWELVQDGDFREDLYYRLDTVKIKLPPLRERPDDIIPIFRTFVTEFSAKYDSVFKGFSDEAKELLISYRWPGNVRELRNVAEQLVVLEKSQFIDTETLKKYLKGRQKTGSADNLPVLSDESSRSDQAGTSFGKADRELVYRALVELRSEISDMKKMLATFLYGAFSGRELKALPQNIQSEVRHSNVGDFNV
ncbi:MAG: sigma-54 dependent transcriptional regulator, partial [Balneolaceae bacterium]|nr:sigma-54 dependent transcriptional regulator [Balneolaceae bacterium]